MDLVSSSSLHPNGTSMHDFQSCVVPLMTDSPNALHNAIPKQGLHDTVYLKSPPQLFSMHSDDRQSVMCKNDDISRKCVRQHNIETQT